MNDIIDKRTWLTVGEVLSWARAELAYPMTPDVLLEFGDLLGIRVQGVGPISVRECRYSEPDTAKLLDALTSHVVALAELALATETPEER